MAKIQEDEIKNKLKQNYFAAYDWTPVIGKIDLAVRSQPQIGAVQTNYLWAETKQGKNKDIYESFIQLILTIGKARIYEWEMPPYFLGAADAEKIAFVEYNKVMQIFSKTDFNWNVTPSDHTTKEFKELYALLHEDLSNEVLIYKYAYDDKLIRSFIKKNFKEGRKDVSKRSVGKNNFTFVYYDWVKTVKDSIAVDWKIMEKAGIFDCDFYLADLMSKDDMSIKDKLKVVLEKTKYKVLINANLGGLFGDAFKEFTFKDDQKAYNQFWNKYERPPKKIYQQYILDRKDLLVPQDIRETKGSYYTPEPWVRLSQEYIAKVLGEDWQEEYYVWDCAAGSGNLLRGLTNKYNIYASDLYDSNVKIMHDAIDNGRLNLIKNNVFQFDFLNDGYKKAADGSWVSDLENCEKIPESLRKIIADPEKRKKLVIYINPPYKEATNGRTSAGTGKNNTGATKGSKAWELYGNQIGAAINEVFAQFTIRISQEIPSCTLAEFSKLKILQAPNFSEFRKFANIELRSLFLMPGNTFDNVTGHFPIGFQIYKTGIAGVFDKYEADVYLLRNKDVVYVRKKTVVCYDNRELINTWAGPELRKNSPQVGWIKVQGNDFQNSNYINIYSDKPVSHNVVVVVDGLFVAAAYHAVRHIISATWLNDRDQFLAPNDSWAGDIEFQTDCLIWSIFNNAVREEDGVCHWIPFYEEEVNSPSPFNSRFMADFLHGKIERKKVETTGGLFEQQEADEAARAVPSDNLSAEAAAVLNAGREIWKYYMSKPGISANASFLDIRAYFQGYRTTDKGKRMMNSTSTDSTYTALLANLRTKIKALEEHIEPKIYEHGFLLK